MSPPPLPRRLLDAPAFGDFTDDDLEEYTPPSNEAHWVGTIPGASGMYWTPARFSEDHVTTPHGNGVLDAAVVALPFCFAEVDPPGTAEQKADPLWCAARVDEQLRHIATLVDARTLPHPTLVVLSGDPRPAPNVRPNVRPGKSVHIYWQLSTPLVPTGPTGPAHLTRWKALQAALAAALGPHADYTLGNPSRKMRLPAGEHDGRRQTLIYLNGPIYAPEALVDYATARVRADPHTAARVQATETPPTAIDLDFSKSHAHLATDPLGPAHCINPEHPDRRPSAFLSTKTTRRLGPEGRFVDHQQRFLHCSKCHTTHWDVPAPPPGAAPTTAPPPGAAPTTAPPPSDGTGIGNAHTLVALMADEYRWAHERKEWARWSPPHAPGHWHLDPAVTHEVFNLAHRVADFHRTEVSNALSVVPLRQRLANHRHAASASGLREMVDVARLGGFPEVSGSAAVFDRKPGLLNTGGPNPVTLHLPLDPTQPIRARPPCREDYLTRATSTPYDPTAQCPRFERFILEVMDGDRTHAAFLQRALGYAISGYCREQKMFFMQGDGGNGKGVLQRALSDVLGSDYCTAAKAETFVERHGDASVPVDLASWHGRRFVFPEELPLNRRLDSAILKTCTGEDRIRARLMRENFFEYDAQFSLFFSANPGYEIDISDPAMRRRFVLIPFNRSFRDNPDLTLRATLRAEAPGILRWLVEGFDAYRHHGLSIPPAMQEAAAEVRLAGDIVQQFLDDRTTPTPPAPTAKPLTNERMYTLFKHWCERNGERHVPSQRRLTQRLVSKGFKQNRSIARFWEGVYEVPQTLATSVATAPAARPPSAPPPTEH